MFRFFGFAQFHLSQKVLVSIKMIDLQEALKRKLNARIEYAKFLQDTVKEMAKEVQNSRSGELKKTAEDLDEFMNNVDNFVIF